MKFLVLLILLNFSNDSLADISGALNGLGKMLLQDKLYSDCLEKQEVEINGKKISFKQINQDCRHSELSSIENLNQFHNKCMNETRTSFGQYWADGKIAGARHDGTLFLEYFLNQGAKRCLRKQRTETVVEFSAEMPFASRHRMTVVMRSIKCHKARATLKDVSDRMSIESRDPATNPEITDAARKFSEHCETVGNKTVKIGDSSIGIPELVSRPTNEKQSVPSGPIVWDKFIPPNPRAISSGDLIFDGFQTEDDGAQLK